MKTNLKLKMSDMDDLDVMAASPKTDSVFKQVNGPKLAWTSENNTMPTSPLFSSGKEIHFSPGSFRHGTSSLNVNNRPLKYMTLQSS